MLAAPLLGAVVANVNDVSPTVKYCGAVTVVPLYVALALTCPAAPV